MKPIEIYRLAISSLLGKKRRTILTVFSIAIGVAAIVVLLSIGYGLERLVQQQTVGLDALKIIDVDAENSAIIKLDNETLNKIKALPEVNDIIPQINSAGKLKFAGSVLDVTVFLISKNYDEYSYQDVLWGDTFDDDSSSNSNILLNDIAANLLGIKSEKEIVGQQIGLEMILPSVVEANTEGDLQNLRIDKPELLVNGVVIDRKMEGSNVPIAYVPLEEVPEISGDVNYSKLKVLLSDADELEDVREKIEGMGLTTTSAADTVVQIESVFVTFRIVLMIVGIVGITIAVLGMFNTLTISLMERMREIGIMKALGMKGKDILHLFFAESILISLLGAMVGVASSFGIGELIELVFRIISNVSNRPVVKFYYTPFPVVFGMLFLGIAVGLVTGIYPAIRAKNIRALNALRYE